VDDRIRELLQDAFEEAPAREANAAIARARRVRAGGSEDDEEGPQFRAYEMVLATFASFASEQLPRLIYHLESIGAHLPDCRGVVIAAFLGDRLYFLDARALVARAAAMLGVSPDELVRRHGTGERRTAVRGAPLLLPGPDQQH
jgi:hypothetical protein